MRRDRYPPATWLRQRTSALVYGEKLDYWGVLPKKSKQELIECYNGFGFVPRLRNQEYRAHARCCHTYYFQGQTWGDETLVMIDIDVQKSQKRGSTAGAIAFATYLKERYFHTLYWE